MDTNTILLALGLPTVIAFIAKIWLRTEVHDKELQRLENEIKDVKAKEERDFDELKKKNEILVIALSKLDSVPADIKEINHSIKNILQALAKV